MKLRDFKVLKLISKIWSEVDQKSFIKARYYKYFHKFPDLDNPKTFNEKVLWIALHYRKELYTKCADKLAVKDYLDEKLGVEIANSVWCKKYGHWTNVDDIDFDSLPSSFVLKSNHSSGQIIICQDKSKLDIHKTKKEMSEWLKENLYHLTGEWQYKNIKPQIICEELLDSDIIDYRIFCFGGKPEYVKLTQHNPDTPRGYDYAIYSTEWAKMEILKTKGYGNKDFEKPESWELMLEYARKLSEDFNFVRTDFFTVDDRIFFAELTFTPSNGWEDFITEELAVKYGDMIKLEKADN